MSNYVTGYYGRASVGKVRGCHTKYIHVAKDLLPMCGYTPGPFMTMQFCASGIYDPYITCPGCKKAVEKERQRE